MNDTASSEQATRPLRVRDFFLGRQPVLDRNQALFGYELLFRTSAQGPAEIESNLSATASVIAHAAQFGLTRAIGDATCFLNVDADVLMSDIFAFLPRERTVLELLPSVEPTEALLWRLAELSRHGYRFAAQGADNAQFQRLLPLVSFIKMDLRSLPVVALLGLVPKVREAGKKLIAEKVETPQEYKSCMDLGFDYFQGYYFAKPSVLGGRKLSPSQAALIELMHMITSDADNAAIERAIKKDVTLAVNLLRLVNTPAAGAGRRIESISQALILLGRRQLQRWLQIMLYAEPGTRGHNMNPLLLLASTRARLIELLAQRLRPAQRQVADIAFTVGIMSLMDTLFCIPMADIVEQIPCVDEVSCALLGRDGFFGELLKLAEAIERMEEGEDLVTPALRELSIRGDDLAELELTAFEWGDSVVRYAI
ncbi:EAL and HDOD domain-containing protein [Massilia horti]|uniref:EAL domain-containing protein n=1 Tax=Massilia horti TaxID=2562153 RepID=A0A4Y9STP0_9BURK|nr:EAL domain-containing protein [Massilia horti]TFW29971.1 EAL domain-containing protein [Massilia horti]